MSRIVKTAAGLLLYAGITAGACSALEQKAGPAVNLSATPTGSDEVKAYILVKQSAGSDFNYPRLSDIDGSLADTINPGPLFEPVPGKYRYYQFLATSKGVEYGTGNRKNFHDILIIKTDEENTILDAFQYTLEWAEPPLQYDMFRSSVKGLKLVHDMDISALGFVRTYSGSEEPEIEALGESGKIRLK